MTCHHHCASGTALALPSRRAVVAALGSAVLSAAPFVAERARAATDVSADERFMRMAIEEARQGDYPFGAVIVRDGQILARGRNLGRTNGDPTALLLQFHPPHRPAARVPGGADLQTEASSHVA